MESETNFCDNLTCRSTIIMFTSCRVVSVHCTSLSMDPMVLMHTLHSFRMSIHNVMSQQAVQHSLHQKGRCQSGSHLTYADAFDAAFGSLLDYSLARIDKSNTVYSLQPT